MTELPTELIHSDQLTDVIVTNNRYVISATDAKVVPTVISIHTGNPIEGINGISIESLLAICKHRLETHNKNGKGCQENDIAIECCAAALEALHTRTERRREAGVLGTTIGN